jgi:Ca2+-binding RTX toxin-like protein
MAYFSTSNLPIVDTTAVVSGTFESGFTVSSKEALSNDYFFSASPGNDSLQGSGGNDILRLINGGNDLIRGGDGRDEILFYTNGKVNGDGGDDLIRGGGNYSYNLYGDEGNDTLVGIGGVSVLLSGGEGNDTLLYSSNNSISPNPQVVFLQGGSGNDYLQSDWKSEMVGGSGSDVFQLSHSSLTGFHTITDFKDGVDKIAFYQPFNSLSLQQSGSNAIIRASNGMVLAQLNNVQSSAITGADFIMKYLGSE